MEFAILGPLEVREGDRLLPLGGRKQRALLALLLMHGNEVVAADRLIDKLWGEEPPETVATMLQVYVSRLRKLLGAERIVTRAPGYLLRVEPGELDLERFERLLEEGRGALAARDAVIAAGRLGEALAGWHGPPLADLAYEPFAQQAIARLEERRLACLEDRIEADLALGRHGDLVGELETLIAEHPLRERLRAQLMLALYRSGRQAEALEAYQETRRALVDELGIEPSAELRELEMAILRQDASLDSVAYRESGAAAEAAASRGVFVGRERELGELLAGLDDALNGRGRLFLLVGEPGIGKSRLAEELASHARARGARVLVGRCWEAGGAPAYWPWVQSLRTYIREAEPEALRTQLGAGAAELAEILPELRDILPGLPERASLDSDGARFRLFDATAEFVRNASESRPILLVLDDLHAADTPSLLLLQFIARELGSTRVLLIGAFRDVDPIPGQSLATLLAEVTREPITRRLSLDGLSEQDVAEYAELTAAEIASPELVAALYEETEGNPLFVAETIRLLTLEGLQPESTGVTISIPQSVRDVIARRLAHLSEECNRLLILASVLGREFDLDALARLGAVSVHDLLDTLDEAMAARVVSDVPGGPGRLRFAHVLIRDTLYEGLTTARRVRLHRVAIETLEVLYGDKPGLHLAELAHHSIAGSDFDKGLRYAWRAGDRAFMLLAYEEAARLYEMALDALDLEDLQDEKPRCELLISIGEAEARAGNTPAARTAFFAATGIARRLGLPRELARAAAGYGGRFMWARPGDDDRLIPLLEEGLAALPDEDVELRARLLARLAGALRDEPSRERRDRLSSEAVELARRTRNTVALAYALDGRSAAILAPDTVAECVALSSELRDLAATSGDTERLANALEGRRAALAILGDLGEAEADVEAERAAAGELRQPALLWQVYSARAMLALTAGRLDEAEELIPMGFAFGERALLEMAITVYRTQRYTLSDFRGSLEEVEQEIVDLAAAYPTRPVFRCVLAYLQARLGSLAEARRAFDDLAKDDFSALPFDQEWLYAMSFLAETSALLADTASTPILYRLLVPWAAFNAADHPEGIRGSVSRYLGLLATTTKRWSEAERHFEDALEMNERMGALPWLAHTQHDYARMLLARGMAGDSERAADLLASALATSNQVGLVALGREVSTRLSELGALGMTRDA